MPRPRVTVEVDAAPADGSVLRPTTLGARDSMAGKSQTCRTALPERFLLPFRGDQQSFEQPPAGPAMVCSAPWLIGSGTSAQATSVRPLYEKRRLTSTMVARASTLVVVGRGLEIALAPCTRADRGRRYPPTEKANLTVASLPVPNHRGLPETVSDAMPCGSKELIPALERRLQADFRLRRIPASS